MIDFNRFVAIAILCCAFCCLPCNKAYGSNLCSSDAALSSPRLVDIDDLVSLRDLSELSPVYDVVLLSPDKKRIAYEVHRADAVQDKYDVSWCMLDLQTHTISTVLEDGGEPRWAIDGQMGTVTKAWTSYARWSPDGSHLAILRRQGNSDELWLVDGTTQPVRITTAEGYVDDLAWSGEQSITFSLNVAFNRKAESALWEEGRSGYLFDDRFNPIASAVPAHARGLLRNDRSSSLESPYLTIDLQTGTVRSASEAERSHLDSERLVGLALNERPWTGHAGLRADRRLLVEGGDERHEAWLQNADPMDDGPDADVRLVARVGKVIDCLDRMCSGEILNAWWSANLSKLYFLRRSDSDRFRWEIYEWKPGSTSPRRLYSTFDVLSGCASTGSELVCFRESITTPRQIVALAFDGSEATVLVDLNRRFESLQFGTSERIYDNTGGGRGFLGYYVAPPSSAGSGGRVPLIIVQYEASGFLRGGVGDEYPIQAFAAKGFGVFVFEEPAGPRWKRGATFDASSVYGPNGKSNVSKALNIAINQLVVRGLVDPARIGITGLSSGEDTANYELVHNNRYSAASLSSLVWAPSNMFLQPQWVRKFFRPFGLGDLTPDAPGSRWRDVSISLNVDKIVTPILVQAADTEYLNDLENFAHLQDAGKPLELFVFHDETHFKGSPAHRQAVYRRNIDWFRFWLQGYVDPDPAKAEQYKRWEELCDMQVAKNPGRTTFCVGVKNNK